MEEKLEPLYGEGEDAYLKGEFHDALDAFFAVKEQSRSEKVIQSMLWNIARCYQRLDQSLYEKIYLEAFLDTGPSEKEAEGARKRLTALTGSGVTPQGVRDEPEPWGDDKGPGSSGYDGTGFDEGPGDVPGLEDQPGGGGEPGIDNRFERDGNPDPGYDDDPRADGDVGRTDVPPLDEIMDDLPTPDSDTGRKQKRRGKSEKRGDDLLNGYIEY